MPSSHAVGGILEGSVESELRFWRKLGIRTVGILLVRREGDIRRVGIVARRGERRDLEMSIFGGAGVR